jgi:transcriptional regulator GlxA family with amidase domain
MAAQLKRSPLAVRDPQRPSDPPYVLAISARTAPLAASNSAAVNMPLRVVYDSVKLRTGRSPYNLIIEKRIERASAMLQETGASTAEVACACGFSSQQHLTATLSRRLLFVPISYSPCCGE